MTNLEKDYFVLPTVGCFSREELQCFINKKRIQIHHLQKLSHGEVTTELIELVEKIIDHPLDARTRYLMESFGFTIGAFLVPQLDWELVAIVNNDGRYMKQLIEMDENKSLSLLLTKEERHSLRLIANTYRLTLSVSRMNLSETMILTPFKYTSIPSKSQ